VDVLIATPNVVIGDGQGRVNLELARYLARRGHRITLLANSVDEKLLSHDCIQWQQVPLRMRLPALLRDVLWSHSATAWLRRHGGRYDVIHLNGASAFVPHHVNTCHFVHGSFRRQLADESTPGLRSRYHRLYSESSHRAERRAFALAQRVVAVSAKVAQELEDFARVPRDGIEIVHNGVDTETFRPDPEARSRVRRELEIADETFGLLFVGELVVPRKGLHSVLEAMHGLPESVHLVVAGTGSPAAYRSVLTGIDARVRFLGFRRDVPALYAAMDCFVYPTRYDACSLAVLEALSAGIPVVTTRESGSGELIESARNGIVLDRPDDVEGLRRSVSMLQSDRALAAELGRQGRLVAEANSWERMSGQYESVYRDIRDT
jgi:glycosyltransferase involved in cell wall biosynthesis